MSFAGLLGDILGLGAFGVFGVFGRVEARDGRSCLALGLKSGELMFRGEWSAVRSTVSILPRKLAPR